MSKQDDLDKLDRLVREKMISLLEENSTEVLPDLSTAVQYLKANNTIAEKKKSSVEDDIKSRVEKAKRRREEKNDV